MFVPLSYSKTDRPTASIFGLYPLLCYEAPRRPTRRRRLTLLPHWTLESRSPLRLAGRSRSVQRTKQLMARTRPRSFAETGKAAAKHREEFREKGDSTLPDDGALLGAISPAARCFLGVFWRQQPLQSHSKSQSQTNTVVKQIPLPSQSNEARKGGRVEVGVVR